jgi:hypothetical protein
MGNFERGVEKRFKPAKAKKYIKKVKQSKKISSDLAKMRNSAGK